MRPAAVLAHTRLGDVVLCQITSNPYVDPEAITLREGSFAQGSLQRVSYARPGKLFAANEALVVSTVGVLKPVVREEIIEAVIRLLRAGSSR
jgi:mRNA interferase MazF